MTTTRTPHKIPHSLLVAVTPVTHGIMILGAILLYWAGKIDATTLIAVLVAFGGAYSGVAGALIAVKRSQAVTSPTGPASGPGVSATPVTTTGSAPVETP